jgi:hypothetical protein
MSIKVQEAPQAPSYAAANIQVNANIATPQAAMASVTAQQSQLNAVNVLSGGRHRGTKNRHRHRNSHSRRAHTQKHKSFIRTYKGRRYVPKEQTGGSSAASNSEQIPVPQVGPLCSSGTQCAGVQNANFTALHNQAKSYSINDGYMTTGGSRGRRRSQHNKHANSSSSHRHHHHHHHATTHHRKTKDHSLTSTIAYNIKKVLRKIFT